MAVPPRQRLTRETWVTAALEALAEGGLAAVAVEPIAARVGATKGSFYWHFRDRDELVQATLELWESRQTGAVIARLTHIPDPRERLRALFDLVITHSHEGDPVVALFRDSSHPAVADVLERVTRRRVDYVVTQLVACGVPRREARRRAVIAYSAYVGWWQLKSILPDLVPTGRAAAAHAAVLQQLVAPSE